MSEQQWSREARVKLVPRGLRKASEIKVNYKKANGGRKVAISFTLQVARAHEQQ